MSGLRLNFSLFGLKMLGPILGRFDHKNKNVILKYLFVWIRVSYNLSFRYYTIKQSANDK